MDHLSKLHLNRTVNEPGSAVLRKLRKLEKWWCLAPKSREPSPQRHKTSVRRYLLRENTKNNIFREQNTTGIAWRQLFTARRFLTETQKLDCFVARRCIQFWKNSRLFCTCVNPKTPNQQFRHSSQHNYIVHISYLFNSDYFYASYHKSYTYHGYSSVSPT